MIVSFSVENFRSFRGEETFSLVASNRFSGEHEDHTFPLPGSSGEKILRTAVVYGANGAGKSNLFKALRYVQETALQPRQKDAGTQRQRFLFAGDPDAVSAFDVQFVAAGNLYRYGFKVNDVRITEEWLLLVTRAKERVIYERTTDGRGRSIIEMPGLVGANARLNALSVLGPPQNQSFLASMRASLESEDFHDHIVNILLWFDSSLELVGPASYLKTPGYMFDADPALVKFTGEFLKAVSTGVEGIDITRVAVTDDEVQGATRGQSPSDLLPDGTSQRLISTGEGEDDYIVLERSSGGVLPCRMSLQTGHRHEGGHTIRLDIKEESDGTRRLMDLIPALYWLHKENSVLFVDEIDRSLHPILVREFLQSFLSTSASAGRQLIVTTHETSLLDQDLLRRDEIWFAEKDSASATHLYSLTDFKVRKDLSLRKNYLEGRFGAIPFIGDLSRIVPEEQGVNEPHPA